MSGAMQKENIHVGNCPECGHFPTQMVGDRDSLHYVIHLPSKPSCDMGPHSHIHELERENERLRKTEELVQDLSKIMHDMVVANQAAWLEWQRGGGAEAAMHWIHNGLVGPGHIPDEAEPWSDDPLAYFSANKSDPFPACFCGRPSSQLWMGHGACSNEHMDEIRVREGYAPTQPPEVSDE